MTRTPPPFFQDRDPIMLSSRLCRLQRVVKWKSVDLLRTRQVHCCAQLRMASDKLQPAKRATGHGKNLWVEFVAIAMETKAINLGQGMPDFGPPQHLVDALCECSQEAKNHQYTRSQGHVRLVNALANMYSQLMGRQLNPMTDVVVSMGAYSILSHAINAFLDEGDEIILVEPFFDCYQPMAKIAGATPIFVPLRPQGQSPGQSKDWALDPGELEAAFSPRTKMIVVNNPNNPLGKVFTREELEMVAELCKKYDVICLMDEVYEWLIYSGTKHVRMASLPGMWERTITVGSAGKTFSATGWKMGWGIGPEHLVKHMQTMHANTGYCYPTLLQEAVARALEVETARLGQPDCYFTQLAADVERKRDEIAQVLREVGLEPIIPDSGYFMMADTTPLGIKFDSGDEPYDFQFAKWMTREKGVATIPPTAFFSPANKHLVEKFVRFCFIKDDTTLQAAYAKLREWAKELKSEKKS